MGKARNIELEEFKSLIADKQTRIIDVRTRQEYEQGHIKGASHINMMDPYFASEIMDLNKSDRYVLYCRSGSRSESAMRLMERSGFEEVYNLSGGILAWEKKGNKVIH